MLCRNLQEEIKVASPPASPRHPSLPLWLLPSGPDQINGLSLRGDQRRHHRGGPVDLGSELYAPNFKVQQMCYIFQSLSRIIIN